MIGGERSMPVRATFDRVWAQIREYFSGLSPRERRRLAILAVIVLALSIVAAWLLGRTNWVTLEAGLPPAVAGQYKTAIEEMGYTCRLADGGTAVEVPEEHRTDIWVNLNTQGLVGTSTLSPAYYESVLDRLGATDKDKSAAMAWQTQAWLQQTYTDMAGITDAKVIITVGEKAASLISTASPPSCSIMVGVENNALLTEAQVQAMVSFAAGAWDGLTVENITLTDRNGTLYDALSGRAEGLSGSSTLAERVALENQTRSGIERQVLNLFTPVVGAGNLRVLVTVELAWDEHSISSVTFAPPVDGMEEGLKVSLYRLWESSSAGEAAGGVPGTDTNGIGTVEYPYLDLEADEYYRKYLEEVNYELNEVREDIIKAQGVIRRLSVGIILNSDAVEDDYTTIMQTLAATALGITVRDVSVSQMPFAPLPEVEIVEAGFFSNPDNLSLIIKAVVVLLLGLAVIALLASLLRPRRQEQLVLADGTGVTIDYVADGEILDLGALPEAEPILAKLDAATEAALAQQEEFDLRSKGGTLVQLESFIERDAEAVVQLLRNWLNEE